MKTIFDKIDWTALTEVIALGILGLIAVVAMCELKVEGKEIALSIGSGIAGYIAKGAINKEPKESDENEKKPN